MTGKMLCWPMHGVGLEKLGKDRKPEAWDIPQPGAEELLVRIDAIGLCFSDIKLIRAGEEHPRVISKDLSKDPVIPGHEAVMTVVEVGANLRDKFKPGSRWIVQADIYVKGVNLAYGYAINGGMAQYSLIDQRILNGDEGCYLLPLGDQVPAAIAALVEPWTCVIASYMIEHRTRALAGGRMLVAMEPGDADAYTFAAADWGAPAKIDCLNVNAATAAALRQSFPYADYRELREIPCVEKYDDIVMCGVRTPALAETIGKLGAVNACISFVGACPEEPCSFDVGSIHYKGWFYQGTPGRDMAAAYGRNVRSKLRRGGACWMLGGAGAMGQMHTQLAVEDADGPKRLLVSDLDDTRISRMMQLLAPRIKERGIEVKTLNPKHFANPAGFAAAVREFAPEGFDDIVMLVPVVPVLNDAVAHLGKDGLMNIFAGIPAGKEGTLDVGGIMRAGHRYVGSSGSRTAHLQHTLDLVRAGKLNPASALAAVGGMNALWEGLQGVADARFPGKTVIFPNCLELPLLQVEELAQKVDAAVATLDNNGFYTMATEQLLFKKFGKA